MEISRISQLFALYFEFLICFCKLLFDCKVYSVKNDKLVRFYVVKCRVSKKSILFANIPLDIINCILLTVNSKQRYQLKQQKKNLKQLGNAPACQRFTQQFALLL